MKQEDKIEKVVDESRKLTYELFGLSPVQAVGELDNLELYFRARNNEWSFEISNENGNLPSDGFEGGFIRKGKFSNAGFMPFKQAHEIIDVCIGEYINQRK